jgi:hypothetical protein
MAVVTGALLGAPGDLDAVVSGEAGAITVTMESEGAPVLTSVAPGVALVVVQPGGRAAVGYDRATPGIDLRALGVLTYPGSFTLFDGKAPNLTFEESWKATNPELHRDAGILGIEQWNKGKVWRASLWERRVSVRATADTRYYLDMGWKAEGEGTFHTFEAEEAADKTYSLGYAGAGFEDLSLQTFPMVGVRKGDQFYGVIGDTPGVWENKSLLSVDVEDRTLSTKNGDGSVRREVKIPIEVDATSVYRARLDGWQHIEAGETQSFTTWIYTSPVQNHYDIQLSAHLALANSKGFNESSLEAILRNTSYLLLRRNLFRPESDNIFISGPGYGWKQWVSDGFWMSRGLDDPHYDEQANNAVFFERVNYEDNAQYFLIWSYLVKQAGGTPDPRTVARAYHFIRKHEVDGLFIPPRLVPEKKNMKTYHDQLEYEDDDAPSSNQGFHCGALMAAKALGFEVTDEDIERAKAGYARMFNEEGGYFATSLKQQDRVGQDSLYGAVLTYAVFGKKLLADEMVKRHLETTMKIQSPYGMRVISKANGDLLDGHSGVYVYGGSWFLNDGANYLAGLIHGMDPAWVDERLLWRLEKELAWMPAFHESISTVNGKPHGHHLYSWNSGFWWLRREVRKQLGIIGPDALAEKLDARLGVVKRDGMLALEPGPKDLQREVR